MLLGAIGVVRAKKESAALLPKITDKAATPTDSKNKFIIFSS